MINLQIEFDKNQVSEIEKALSGVKNGAPKAMSRAINRTVSFGKTRISKVTREEYTIRAGDIKRASSTYKANASNLRGEIRFKGRPKQLRDFARRVNRKGLRVSVKRSTGFKRIPTAFIRTINNGPAILRRVGSKRYPLEVLHGPSVPQMVGNVNVTPKVEKDIEAKLSERLDHEMNALLKGYTK